MGKSTLARLVVEQLGGSYLTLDDPLTLSEAAGDADGLVASTTGLTVIDEVRRVPDVLRSVKLSVDRDPTPGRFLLTGSANLLGMRAVMESLAGRAVYLDLLPLSWSESIGRTRPHTIDQAFSSDSADEFAASLQAAGPGAGDLHRWSTSCGGPRIRDHCPSRVYKSCLNSPTVNPACLTMARKVPVAISR